MLIQCVTYWNWSYNYHTFKPGHFYFGTYFYPDNALSEKNRVIQHSMRNLLELKVRCYADIIDEINEFLTVFIRGKESDKTGEIELN